MHPHPAVIGLHSALHSHRLVQEDTFWCDRCRYHLNAHFLFSRIAQSMREAIVDITLEEQRRRNMGMDLATIQEESRAITEWSMHEKVQQRLAAALAGRIDVGQFTQSMLVAFQEPQIVVCTAASKYKALFKCASLALLPEQDQVALIQFKNRRCPKCGETAKKGSFSQTGAEICTCRSCGDRFAPALEVVVMPQWQGMKDIMQRHDVVRDVTAFLVHNLDEFELPLDGIPIHRWDPFNAKRTFRSTADIRGGFCKAEFNDGRPVKYHFISAAEIEARKSCAKDDSFWNKWPKEMMLKTVYRDAYKRRMVPIDPVSESQLEIADQIDSDPHQPIAGERETLALLQDESKPAIDVDSRETPRQTAEKPQVAPERLPKDDPGAEQAKADPAQEKPQEAIDESQPVGSDDQGTEDQAPETHGPLDEWQLLLDSAATNAECQQLLEYVREKESEMDPEDVKTVRGWIDVKARKLLEQKR